MLDRHSAIPEDSAGPVLETPRKLPLGVGGVITDSFAIFFHHIVVICLIGLVPMLFGQVLPGLALTYATGFAEPGSNPFGVTAIITSLTMGFLLLAVYTLTTAILIQLTYDEQLGRRIRVRNYVRPALKAVPAILALSVAIALALLLSQALLMLFASASPYLAIVSFPLQAGFLLWVLAALSVCAPAVVLEQAGLRGLNRSAELTREYRWPIIGTLALTGVLIVLFYLVAGAVIMVFSMVTGGLVGAVLFGLLSTAGTSILVIAVTLIYTRLREIKDGVGLDQIATVFD